MVPNNLLELPELVQETFAALVSSVCSVPQTSLFGCRLLQRSLDLGQFKVVSLKLILILFEF